MYWRLSLDQPYNFCTTEGWQKEVHCADFAPQADSLNNTWREPLTRLVMLVPSFLRPEVYNTTDPATSFQMNLASWAPAMRGLDAVQMFSLIRAAAASPSSVAITAPPFCVSLPNTAFANDSMVWGAATRAALAQDESFSIWYHGSNDEVTLKHNWWSVQWDNIQVHVRGNGQVDVYLHDRANPGNVPTLVDTFSIGQPGDFQNKTGQFTFIPIPTRGLLMFHTAQPASLGLVSANVGIGAVKSSYLIPWPTSTDTSPGYLFQPSPLLLGVNPYMAHTFGLHHVRFASSGTYTDATLDPGFQPTTDPVDVSAFVLQTETTVNTATLVQTDGVTPWSHTTSRQGRVQIALSSLSGGLYTAFVEGYGVRFDPVFQGRDTTPLYLASQTSENLPDRTLEFEYTTDEWGKVEGEATALFTSEQGMAIVERGDTTWKLENSVDNSHWTAVCGGIAKDFDPELRLDPNYRPAYIAKFRLCDFWEVLREKHKLFSVAFDSVSVGDSINVMLRLAGFSKLASIPALAANTFVPPPPPGQSWRLAPKIGDDGEEILRLLLLHLWQQKVEWRLRFDWPTTGWVLEQKPYNAGSLWTLHSLMTEESAGDQVWAYADVTPHPEPPECNRLVIAGKSTADTTGVTVQAAPIQNDDSISNPASPDYLGRVKEANYYLDNVSDQGWINRFARALEPSVCHRHLGADLDIPHLNMALMPNQQVAIVAIAAGDTGTPRSLLASGWIKKTKISVTQSDGDRVFGLERMLLTVDSMWEGTLTK